MPKVTTDLRLKLGESLIRAKIAELQERVAKMEQDSRTHRLPPRVERYQRRHIRQDFAKLEKIARRYGFPV